MKEDPLQKAGDWFEGLSRLYGPRRVLSLATSLYRIICDKNDNWQAGAIATLIDLVGVAVIKVSFSDGDVKVVTVDFSVSYFSTIKIHEEVEIEAKLVGHKAKLSSALVEVRRKDNGELVASAKLWMTSADIKSSKL
ncbi:PREDICTED: uncharacterized protein LOC104592145 [Nelumbo nucifera]|uniref:Uncharacterized protein LOC104592145 n=1 Tax=Nelumbo nucifera TaxID=4432 RepID=A0A1U7ZMA3_NELNU|nr:PREDICTED: uncharacterized protein LOC104592145 [Nelumbo nucifera]